MNGKSNAPEIPKTPAWETLVMIASFALVWAYFLASQSAKNVKVALSGEWNIALLLSLGILVWVFVRRLKRILLALGEQKRR